MQKFNQKERQRRRMSKTKRSFVRDEYDEDDGDSFRLYEEKMARRNERFLEQALKTKNIEAFIPEDDYDYVEDMMESGEWEEIEDYVACVECGKVLITEEDFKGAMTYYNEISHESKTTCSSCLKNTEVEKLPEED